MNDLTPPQQTSRKRSLRIATVTETFPPEVNGVAMTMERMTRALQERGHRIQLIRPRRSRADEPASEPNWEEVLIPSLPIPRYEGLRMGFPSKSALLRRWSLARPEVVHIATEGPLGWAALAAARKLELPVVSDFHTNFHTYSKHYGMGLLRRPIDAYLRNFHNKCLHTLVPTESLRRELLDSGYRNLIVVARGVDCELFTPRRRNTELRRAWGAEGNDLVALYVGRVAPEKNLPLVFAAYRRMAEINPTVKLVVVGDGPALAGLRTAHPGVVFAGARVGKDLAEHFASADVFLFPSLTETYGNVTVEAMASGLAVVAYDYAAAREHIHGGANGVLAGYDTAVDFVAAAERLAASPEEIARLGREARVTAQGLGWEAIHGKFEWILMSVVQQEEQKNAQSTRLSFVPD